MFTSEAYTLQYNTTIDKKIITAGELVAKAKYLFSMQVHTNWYWNQLPRNSERLELKVFNRLLSLHLMGLLGPKDI